MMISSQRLKEFGFGDADKFPKLLLNHNVTVSLPTAITHHVPPVSVVIDRGLAVPVQMQGAPNGTIIKSDGTIAYVSHRDPADQASPLQVTFVDDIIYDVRAQVYNIMRRAVEADRGLNDVWQEVLAHWTKRYPPFIKEIERQNLGEFTHARDAVHALGKYSCKAVVQTLEQFEKGWQGEEFTADKMPADLKRILKDPVFHSRSTFRLYHESRTVPVVKLVVIPPADAVSYGHSRGIDLD